MAPTLAVPCLFVSVVAGGSASSSGSHHFRLCVRAGSQEFQHHGELQEPSAPSKLSAIVVDV